MSDERNQHETFDREISLNAIGWFFFGLVVTIILSFVVVAVMNRMMMERAAAADPLPSPISAANERRLPPLPRLQTTPEDELAEMRREEARILDSYGWADEKAGLARVPIERAIELLVDKGDVVIAPPAKKEGAK